MSRGIKERIAHLLDEPADAPDRVDARLAASFAEALQDASGVGASHDDAATIAAYLDGRLSDADLADFRAALIRDPSLRAELEAARALIDAASAAPTPMPQDLLARAEAAFAPPARPPQPSARERLAAMLWPGRQNAWAYALALLAIAGIAVIGPTVLYRGASGPDIGHEQLETGPEPGFNVDVPQRRPNCESTPEQKPKSEPKAKSPEAPKKPEDTDPCPQTPSDDGRAPN